MGNHDELSATTLGGKVGCLAGAVVGFPVFSVLMFSAFYGDCFGEKQCESGQGLRFLVIIALTLTVAVPVGLLTRKLVNRAKNRSC